MDLRTRAFWVVVALLFGTSAFFWVKVEAHRALHEGQKSTRPTAPSGSEAR